MRSERRETIWVENWYELTDLPNDVVAIGEPKHQEEVFCYLVKGSYSDLLIDTGMDIIPITHVLERVRNSSKPLEVVNTHWHYDHVGGNRYFDEIKVPKNIDEVSGLLRGWTNGQLADCNFFDGFKKNGESTMPSSFDASNFLIPESKNINQILVDGYTFDLGDRKLRVLETPGHTPGGICLFDETNEMLFTGDTLYEGPLYAFEKESDTNKYLESLKTIANLPVKLIHPGHNHSNTKNFPDLVQEAIELFERMKKKEKWDAEGEFPNTVEYHLPATNNGRRLKIIIYNNPTNQQI